MRLAALIISGLVACTPSFAPLKECYSDADCRLDGGRQLCSSGACADPAHADAGTSSRAPSWTDLHLDGPDLGDRFAMAYDTDRKLTVYSGGVLDSRGDLWVLPGDSPWRLEKVIGIHFDHVMVYDPVDHLMLIFGGNRAHGADEETHRVDSTETWDGLDLVTLDAPTRPPPARADASATFDSMRGKVLLFGGRDNCNAPLGDTWQWSKTSGWEPIGDGTGPTPRFGTALVYDPNFGGVILFGGVEHDGSPSKSDTWLLRSNTTRWEKLAFPLSPPPRQQMGIVFDERLARSVMFGGMQQLGNGVVALGETWLLGPEGWSPFITDKFPAARRAMGMVYAQNRGEVVLYGGWVPGYIKPAEKNGVYDTWSFK